MLGRKTRNEAAPDEILGFLGEGTLLEGDLNVRGVLRVDGEIRGKIESSSALIVGPHGVIESQELRVATLCVAGVVRGTLHVRERLEIQPGGRVIGHVVLETKGLVIAPGGQFEGTVEMPEDAAASA
ncbi:MAG TPA: polymer-forming cytoskeletal protein [Candidatus Polarisedimenticolaceae bacterium]